MAPKLDLVAFFEDSQGDYRGRKFSDILKWSDNELEASHDYIQTLFPLPEASQVIWSATIIDRRVFDAFRARPELRAKLREAFMRILSFYGLKWCEDEGRKSIVKGDNFKAASDNWVCRFDHNHLRITRIIRSLRVLGLEEEARVFFEALKLVQESSNISQRSLMYWKRSAFRPLDISPDVEPGDEGTVRGPRYLREFERKRHEEKEDEEEADSVEPVSESQIATPTIAPSNSSD